MFAIHCPYAVGKLPLCVKIVSNRLPFCFCFWYLHKYKIEANLQEIGKEAPKESDEFYDVYIDSKETVWSTKQTIERGDGRPITKCQKKESKEDILLTKAMECIERSAGANKNTSKRDADDIFGEYVATELRSIKNEETKRHVKFRIQSLFFSSLSSHPITTFPTPIHVPGAQAMHLQWDHSCSSTPTDGWHQSISPYCSFNEECADTY